MVAPAPEPYVFGGTERAVAGLTRAIEERTPHEAELVTLPVVETNLPDLMDAYERFATLDLGEFDRVITVKYPAWAVRHPHKIVYLFHPLRGFYDTWHTFRMPSEVPNPSDHTFAMLHLMRQAHHRGAYDELFERWHNAVAALGADHPDFAFPGPFARTLVRWLDEVALAPDQVERYVALSRTVARRPDYFPPGVVPAVAHLPAEVEPGDPAPRPRPYFFTASRLDGPKRHRLLIDAMAHVDADVDLVIAGTGPLREELEAAAAHDPRVQLVGFVDDAELPGLYAGALAVPFLPEDEDFGLVTLEAQALGTPVVTCTDAGGPAELVKDRVTGLVVPPEPQPLGAALQALADDPALARALGEAGRERAARTTWDTVLETVLGDDRHAPEELARRQREAVAAAQASADPNRVVVLTTFAIDQPAHGGQIRARNLYGALARTRPVEVVALVDHGVEAARTELEPGLVQTLVPRSTAHHRVAEELSLDAGLPVSDVVAGQEIALTPAYARAVEVAASGASAVVLAEPYLSPVVAHLGLELPVVYDAYNVEVQLKATLYPDTELGRSLLADVRRLELGALRAATVAATCSAEDAAALAELAGADAPPFTVVANGTDVPDAIAPLARRTERSARWRRRYWTAGSRQRQPTHLAVFFGSWHPPNLDAAELILEVAPELPDVLFLAVGRHGDAFALRPTPPNVVFAGQVPLRAKDELLAAADVALNPMRLGSGSNLKLLEYLAAGIPVVSTPFGARGVDVADDVHLRFAEPERFAEVLAEVLAHPDDAHRRAEEGHRLVADRYSWDVLGGQLAELVASVAPVRSK